MGVDVVVNLLCKVQGFVVALFGQEVRRTRYIVVDEEVVHPGGGDVVLQPFEVHPMTAIAEYHFLFGEVILFVGVARVVSVVHYSVPSERLLLICFLCSFVGKEKKKRCEIWSSWPFHL